MPARWIGFLDFNGTLVRDFENGYQATVNCIETFAPKAKIPTRRECRLGKTHLVEFYHSRGVPQSVTKEMVYSQWYSSYHSSCEKKFANLTEGVRRVLAFLESKKIPRIIVSGFAGDLTGYLEYNKLTNAFEEVYSRIADKAEKMQEILAREKVNPQNAFYVGDTPEDVLAAKRAGVRAIGLISGFTDETLIRQASPDFYAENFYDVWDFIRLEMRIR
jgi:phosphoglycolate phosphatase-like HAD superfamily hydrolase